MTSRDEAHKRLLIERYLAGDATEQELMVFFGLLHTGDLAELIEEYMDADIAHIRDQIPEQNRRRFPWRYLAAVVLLIATFTGGYLLIKDRPAGLQISTNHRLIDKAPGRNQAVLTLANGQKIQLTKNLTGLLAIQGNTVVKVTNTGMINYSLNRVSNENASPVYNTMSTRNGEQSPFPLVLADGTKVWLNAASSITFPTSFRGASREVKITGEAYFEVAHNAAKPFRVTSKDQVVEVLGTHFNINSYADEATTQTTLLEGSVKVFTNDTSLMIRPGQVSSVFHNSANKLITVKTANVAQVVAWRKGLFHFDNASVETVLRNIARWYDVQVVYKKEQSGRKFSGKFYRDVNLSQILQILNTSGIKTDLEHSVTQNTDQLIIY